MKFIINSTDYRYVGSTIEHHICLFRTGQRCGLLVSFEKTEKKYNNSARWFLQVENFLSLSFAPLPLLGKWLSTGEWEFGRWSNGRAAGREFLKLQILIGIANFDWDLEWVIMTREFWNPIIYRRTGICRSCSGMKWGPLNK